MRFDFLWYGFCTDVTFDFFSESCFHCSKGHIDIVISFQCAVFL